MNQLTVATRRRLLQKALPYSAYLDLELISARAFSAVLEQARAHGVRSILSFHDFEGTPSMPQLAQKVAAAERAGADICKIATRVDTDAQLDLLLEFYQNFSRKIPLAAMGMGKLGRRSRDRKSTRLNSSHSS